MKKKVLVVDLDGTLYSINTFHYFIKYLLAYSFSNLKLMLFIKIISLSGLRVLRLLSHARLKYYILLTIKIDTQINYKNFVNTISGYKRDIFEVEKESYDLKILATAAPLCYSKIIALEFDFDSCIATKFPSINYNAEFENSKDNKKKNVLNYLKKKGFTSIDTFITDHIDDLPLANVCERNIIINPSKEFVECLNNLNIQYIIRRD